MPMINDNLAWTLGDTTSVREPEMHADKLICKSVRVVLALLIASGLAGCSPAPNSYPDPTTAVCVPMGDPGVPGMRGPTYACAAASVSDGNAFAISYLTSTDAIFRDTAPNTWVDVMRLRPLPDDQLAAFSVSNGSDAIHPPPGPGCLFTGGLFCVSPDHPSGFAFNRDEQGVYQAVRPPTAIRAKDETIPDSLTLQQAKDFLAGYAIWAVDARVKGSDPFSA